MAAIRRMKLGTKRAATTVDVDDFGEPIAKRSNAEQLSLPGEPVWKRDMNPEQLAAILHDGGPARMLAAAGSGKTRVLVHRIARLVEQGTPAERILALTFSKKAADEMSERVTRLGIDGARVGTWHSLALQILKQDRTRYASWTIQESSKVELKEVLGWKGMDWKGADVTALASFISRCKANLFAPSSDAAAELAKSLFGWESKRALEAFHLYNEKLADKAILTYDDFLVFACEHLESGEDVRRNWASKWDFVIQDEAQDENQAQRHLAHLLARDHRNYMVVGDVYQAIYGFRGSSPAYLAKFEEEWPGAVTYWLPRNYRSTTSVIDAANGIVRKARVDGIDPQDMVGHRPEPGTVRALASETLDDEAANFIAWIQEKTRVGEGSLSDFTALFRTNAQSRALEEALLGARIPYVVVGGTSFYERKEVRDVLAYLRVACGRPQVDDVKRCINAPFRFLGAKFVEKVTAAADREVESKGRDASALDWPRIVLDVAAGERIQERQKYSAREWADLVVEIGRRVKQGGVRRPDGTLDTSEATPTALLSEITKRTRYLEWITKEEGEESIETSGVANVRELIRVASRFPTCAELLDYVDETIRASRQQRKDAQAGGERVLLMSVHRSKGLEWPHVWVAGMNEAILPHPKGDPEEERRLAYVAVTRARDSLVMSYVRTMVTRAGIRDAHPSRFILDSGVDLGIPEAPAESLAEALGSA